MADTCKLCHKQSARYTCPRCNVRYCSITCYRCVGHQQCSETFYRECFMDGLTDFNSTDEDQSKVMAMLKRLDDDTPEPDSDDEDEPDLAERMAGLDLDTDTDEVWRRLTDSEKAEFTKMAGDGRLSSLVTLWEPWWRQKDASKVEEVGQMEVSPAGSHPALHHAPQLDNLTKAHLSPTIPYGIINILYGYVYIARLHNGSHGDTPTQTMKELEAVSEALGSRSFEDVPSALHACFQTLQHKIITIQGHCMGPMKNIQLSLIMVIMAKSSFVSRDFEVGVLCDLKDVLQGASGHAPLIYIMAALSDIRTIAKSARRGATKDLLRAAEGSVRHIQLLECKKRWFAAHKKTEFLLSWCHKYGLQLEELGPQVDITFCMLSTEMAHHHDDRKRLEEAWGGKQPPKMHRFIEEIN